VYNEEKRPKSSTLAGFEEKFVNLYTGLSSSNEDMATTPKEPDADHKRTRSIWRRQASRSAGTQQSEIVKRSASTGRLCKNPETDCDNSAVRPPFFAYKLLPNVWVGDLRSANCVDLLSDGGSEHEMRQIRRRVVSSEIRHSNGIFFNVSMSILVCASSKKWDGRQRG
jgi:hypothetical protein